MLIYVLWCGPIQKVISAHKIREQGCMLLGSPSGRNFAWMTGRRPCSWISSPVCVSEGARQNSLGSSALRRTWDTVQHYAAIREMENISKGPTFGDFVTIHTEGSMQDNTVARLQSTRVQTPISPHVMYWVIVSLWTVKIFPAQH